MLLLLVQLAGEVFAAEKLQVDLIPIGLRPRNQAPIPVEVRFKWNSARILEGRLEMEFHEGNHTLGRYRSGELALTGGEQRFRMLLPPALAPFADSQVDVQMKFAAVGNTLELDPTVLSMPTASERSLVVAWCDSGALSDAPNSDLVRSLMFEHFWSPQEGAPSRSLGTSVARLTPEDLPAQPLGFTAFDVVVLTAEAFNEATERQLQALARWTRGGGSVCVLVGGSLQSRHADFLNQLAEATPESPAYLLGSAGNLLPPLQGTLFLHSGVGRAVVVPSQNGASTNADWRTAAAFLWKVRGEWLQTMTEAQRQEPVPSKVTKAVPMTISDYAARVSPTPNRTPMTFDTINGMLALTDEQKPQVKAALDDWTAALKALRSVPPPDRRNQLLAARQTFQTNLQAILTPDQLSKFQAAYPRIFSVPSAPRPQFFNNSLASLASYGSQPSMLSNELLSLLMPHTVRLIPFSALVGLLALFLAMIGPADYYLLGFLRRRKFTWILFPATSVAFTVATVLMANHYLGLRDQRRSVIVVDLAKDGTALRWNQYELVFAARNKQAVTSLKDALWAPLEIQNMGDYGSYIPNAPSPYYRYNRNYGYSRPTESDSSAPLYEGVLPVSFQTRKPLRQWQPVLNRIFSFEPPPVPLPQNWGAVESAWPDVQSVRAKLSEKKAFNGDIYAISSRLSHSISMNILPAEIVEQICRGEEQGWLSMVSQISPTGGGNFEDISAMDFAANDSALAIVTQVGDDIVVYRRFFYGN